MQRIAVVGNSASGKSTLAAQLAAAVGGEHIELDSIFHQPNWQQLPTDEFREQVQRRIAGERWVTDGNYAAVRDLIWQRADTVVWLDLPRRYARTRVIKRTLSRAWKQTELWNGNHERRSNVFKLNADDSVIVWAWTKHDHYRDQYEALSRDPEWAHLNWVRLQSPAAVTQFLQNAKAQ